MDIEAQEERTARLASAALALIFLALSVVWFGRRAHDWDLLAYSACVLEQSKSDPDLVHRRVYGLVEEKVPAGEAEILRSGNEYRARLAAEPEAFAAQLPFYRGRILYIGALSGLTKLAGNPVDAAFLLSWLGGVASLLALWRWLTLRGSGSAAAVIGNLLALVAIGFWFEVPTTATPDALTAGFLLWGALLVLETRRGWLGALLLSLAVATRADAIALAGPLLVVASLPLEGGRRLSRGAAALGLGLSAAAFMAGPLLRETHAPWVVFHHTFIEYKAFPALETPPLDVAAWASWSLRALPQFKAPAPLLFTLAGLAALVLGHRRGGRRDAGFALALAVLAGTGMHFALVPGLWPRLMFPYWVLAALALGRGRHPMSSPVSWPSPGISSPS